MRSSSRTWAPSTTIRFIAVGHVTNDRVPDGIAPGGSALYAALTARQLGCDATVVTSHGPDFTGAALLGKAGVQLSVTPAAVTTCFENRTVGGVRRQRLHATAAPLTTDGLAGEVLLACPVAGELASVVAPAGAVVGACLQGWLREVSDGVVSPRGDLDVTFLSPCHVVFVSDEDLPAAGGEALVQALTRVAQTVVVTEGARGSRLYFEGRTYKVEACPANEVDATGAGDVYAAAFLVSVARRESLLAAAVVATCAASLSIEGEGPSQLAGMASKMPAKIKWYRKNTAEPRAVRPC